jgi:hypothetical protein
MHHNERANAGTKGRAEAVVSSEPDILGINYSHGYEGLPSSQTFLWKCHGNFASLFLTDSRYNFISLRIRATDLKMDKMFNGSVANLLLYQ